MNEQEQSSRYEWQIVSIRQEKPHLELGNISQTMWAILKRERREKKEKVHKSPSKHSSTKSEQPVMTYEELQQFFIQQYVPFHDRCNISAAYYSSPSIGTPSYASSVSSMDSTDIESQSSGYTSEADSVISNLTTGSSASSSSNTSIATPPTQRTPLRGILRKPNQEVSIHSDTASDISISPNPFARAYIGTAPHAKKEFRRARKSGRLPEHQLDTASTTTSSTTIRKTRFSDEASFCIAYDYYDTAEESEGEVQFQEPEESKGERRGWKRRVTEPGALAISKYVQYGSDWAGFYLWYAFLFWLIGVQKWLAALQISFCIRVAHFPVFLHSSIQTFFFPCDKLALGLAWVKRCLLIYFYFISS